MRNPEGGAAPRTPQLMYKVLFPLQFFFFLKGGGIGGEYGPEPDNLRMWLHSNRQQPTI